MLVIIDKHPWLLVLLFPPFWCGVMVLCAQLFGWARVAAEYPLWDSFEGSRWSFQSGQFGWANYGNCLTVGAGPQGLYFSVFFPFRPGHPPMLVPWEDVTAKPGKSLFSTYVDLRFCRVPEVRVRLSQRLASQLQSAAGSAWRTLADERHPIEPAQPAGAPSGSG